MTLILALLIVFLTSVWVCLDVLVVLCMFGYMFYVTSRASKEIPE